MADLDAYFQGKFRGIERRPLSTLSFGCSSFTNTHFTGALEQSDRLLEDVAKKDKKRKRPRQKQSRFPPAQTQRLGIFQGRLHLGKKSRLTLCSRIFTDLLQDTISILTVNSTP
ncbi:MAG: hypothetical protein R2791_16820 [Saprospiraceae bacterium]